MAIIMSKNNDLILFGNVNNNVFTTGTYYFFMFKKITDSKVC